jgi:hypothetical protein
MAWDNFSEVLIEQTGLRLPRCPGDKGVLPTAAVVVSQGNRI